MVSCRKEIIMDPFDTMVLDEKKSVKERGNVDVTTMHIDLMIKNVKALQLFVWFANEELYKLRAVLKQLENGMRNSNGDEERVREDNEEDVG